MLWNSLRYRPAQSLSFRSQSGRVGRLLSAGVKVAGTPDGHKMYVNVAHAVSLYCNSRVRCSSRNRDWARELTRPGEQLCVGFCRQLVRPLHMSARNQQRMTGRDGIYVEKRYVLRILPHDVGRRIALYDAAENA